MVTKVVIWDSEGSPPQGEWTNVLWRGFSDGLTTNTVSIPSVIEGNADMLKACYLAWVYELGETRIQGRRLVDHLELRSGFSCWWMTLLVEKCNFSKSPQINEAIRLLAFTHWATGHSISHITLVSAKQLLAECIHEWCDKSNIQFEWQRSPKHRGSKSCWRRVYASLPVAIQAWVWLATYVLERWPIWRVGLNEWRSSQGRITFITYSDNCVPEAIWQRRYESRYWAQLPEMLKRESRQTNWLHLYVKDNLLPTAKQAATLLTAWNQTERGKQRHVMLDTFLCSGAVFRTLRDWFTLTWVSKRLERALHHAQKGRALNLWPLLRGDWHTSMVGATAMQNLLKLNLLEVALKSLPQQQQGVYLQENMGWEFGLNYAWRAVGHGCLIGTPHATVRFWDLRYFFDPRSYLRTGHNDLPLPNLVACNGPLTRSTYEEAGYPREDLIDVEALRYLHLGQTNSTIDSVQYRKIDPMRLLVLGDYLPSNTRLQLKLLGQAISLMLPPLEIIFKPHPNCPIQQTDYPMLRLQVSMEPISKLLAECHAAYASAVTSAAVDAYCSGMPIISVLDPNTLNLSPLRGCAGALFVSTPEALANALTSIANNAQTSTNRPAYFSIDTQLANWRSLLL